MFIFMKKAIKFLEILAILAMSFTFAQTNITFWHSQVDNIETIEEFARAFNTSQTNYIIEPIYAGTYPEASVKLITAVSNGTGPVIFDAEVTVFAKLVEEEAALPLSDLTAFLSEEFINDIYPALWNYGIVNGERYGLPWNMSLPVLFYNASLFKQRGVDPPQTWEDFEEAAKELTTRQTKGYINVSMSFIFETMVTTRGGRIVTEDGRPNFNSPEAIEALTMLKRMTDDRHVTNRSIAEIDVALVDFVRTRGMMALASLAFWTQGQRYSIAFEPGAVVVPMGISREVPLIGAQIVVMKDSSEAERLGAFAFWQFLMQPENITTWVKKSYFLPARKSALPLLESWYSEDPIRGLGLEQLEYAVERPKVGAYAIWQDFLQEAMEKALKGRMSPEEALTEAQRRAEAEAGQ